MLAVGSVFYNLRWNHSTDKDRMCMWSWVLSRETTLMAIDYCGQRNANNLWVFLNFGCYMHCIKNAVRIEHEFSILEDENVVVLNWMCQWLLFSVWYTVGSCGVIEQPVDGNSGCEWPQWSLRLSMMSDEVVWLTKLNKHQIWNVLLLIFLTIFKYVWGRTFIRTYLINSAHFKRTYYYIFNSCLACLYKSH